MDESSKIREVGQGFFNPTGQLKSKEELRAEDTKTRAAEPQSGEAAVSESTITNSLGAVRSRFSEDTNKVVSALNVNQDNIKDAQKIVKAQIETARDLKQALRDNDDATAKAKIEKLTELQTQREKLADKVKSDNAEHLDVRHKNINLGNQQKGIVEVKEVEFKASPTKVGDLDNAKDVTQFIEALKSDADSLKTQRQDVRETRREVRDITQEADQEISRIQGDAIRSFEDASRAANKIASDISSGAQSVFQNVSVSAVQRLLTA